jgi:hypothetical protein
MLGSFCDRWREDGLDPPLKKTENEISRMAKGGQYGAIPTPTLKTLCVQFENTCKSFKSIAQRTCESSA